MLPKISIITPCFNQGQFIEDTILSIINQNYPNLEYFIIDGGSTDNTIEIVKKFEKYITYWVSEKDNGQTHAINKGLKKATGDILAYLNSDDCLLPGSLFEIANQYKTFNPQYSNLLFVGNCFWGKSQYDKNGILDKPNFPEKFSIDSLRRSGLGSQPSIFWTKPFTNLLFYDTLAFCMDYEFWLRLLSNNFHVVYINKTLSFFRIHDQSKSSNLKHIEYSEAIGISLIYSAKLKNKNDVIDLKKNLMIRLQNDLEYFIWNNTDLISKVEYFKIVFNSGLPLKKIIKLVLKRINLISD